MRASILVAALVAACVSAPVHEFTRATFTPEELPTVAEASAYRRTATSAQVEEFLARLDARSDLVRTLSIGTSNEGRDLVVAFVADPPLSTPQELRASAKPLVFLVGNIHAGEVCGKEALAMLAREYAGGHALLEHVNLAFLPNYNPDGNDRMAPDNRPGQVGPEEMGTRANAQGLDLNRDWVKADAPETRAFIGFLNDYDPLVIVDTHTTDGSHHRYLITYQGPKHPAGDGEVIAYVRDTLLPAVGATLRERTGFDSFFYGNFEAQHTQWTTYPADPRYGEGYRGMRNRVAILSEAYSYAPFEERVVGTLEFCRAIVEYTAEHHAAMQALCDAADARTVARGAHPTADDTIALAVEARPFEAGYTVLGYEEYDASGAHVGPGAPREWTCSLVNDFVPTLSVALPRAYLVDPAAAAAIGHLELHGVEFTRLVEPLDVEVESYRVLAVQAARQPFQGRVRTEEIEVATEAGRRTFPAGTVIVRTAQPLGALAAYLLEPQAEDGLAAWNFFDPHLAAGALFPVARARVVPEALKAH
jgi:hypothetical protein